MHNTQKIPTRHLVLIGLVTALTCILAPLTIPLPFSPVPISFTNLVLFLSIFILGYKYATISYIIYLLLGFVGLPVFSGFTGGIGKLAGPTGGYLIGFLFLTIIGGFLVEKFQNSLLLTTISLGAGMILPYLFGTTWLCIQMDLSFFQGLTIAVFPYLIGDGVKIAITLLIGPTLCRRLARLHDDR